MRQGEILQGKYRIEGVIGMGGMGVVVAAHHLERGGKVAIKSLLPQGRTHKESLLRFEREARAAARIKSQHVARVLDVARFDDGVPYLVMEHLDGCDLAKWLRTRGPLEVEQAVELVAQACDAIAEAHTLGIVHRDLKPANLFVVKGNDGRLKVKVLDFGISKTVETATGLEVTEAAMTRTSSVLGSPEYMSPEQFKGPKSVDWRTDIWSIGATLFELLTGQKPFSGQELVEIAFKIIHDPAPRIDALRAVPPGLALVIQRCLEKDRAARYQSVAELAAALAPFVASRSQTIHASSLAATIFASPSLPAPAPTPRSWELAPVVATVPPRAARAHHALASIAAVTGMFLLVALCTFVGRKASPVEAASSPEVSSVEPPAVVPAPVMTSTIAPEPSSKQAPAFRGTHGVTRARWVLNGGVYNGVIHTNGATGYVEIHTVEPGAGPVVIREELRLQHGARGWSYVGSHPTYANDGEPVPNFYPNVFHLVEGSIVETCAAGTMKCARVQTGS